MRLYKSDEFGRFVPTQGVVILRGILEFWVPDTLSHWIKYDHNQLPVSRVQCIFLTSVVLWCQQDSHDNWIIIKRVSIRRVL